MAEKTIENKFKKEEQEHPRRFKMRALFEPGYMLRATASIPKHNPIKRELYKHAIPAEVARLSLYGITAFGLYHLTSFLLK